jgi:threonine/homoserine/homoserine lactone efflux protein
MGNVLINLLPLILGSAILPVGLIINIILLMGANGVARSAALIAGVSLVRLIQGVLFGFIFGASATSSEGGSSPVTSTLLVIIGLLFAIKGIKTYRNEPDPDDPPPKLMTMVDTLSPTRTFLLGVVWVLLAPKLWVFTLGAISVIGEANLSSSESVIAYLIYVVGCVSFFLILLVIDVVAPEQSKTTLVRLRTWMEQNNRVIMIIVSAVFGALFLYKGIVGLIR